MTEPDKLLTVNEAADLLGKRPETVRRWIAVGKIESRREGARVYIPIAALNVPERVCEHCGKDYGSEPLTRKARYCSDACRWAAAYQERKVKNPAKRGPGRPPKSPKPDKQDLSNERLSEALKHSRERVTKPSG